MKRKLNTTEKELTKKGITKREKEITQLKKDIQIHEAQKEFIEAKRKYEDLIRPYNREVEEKNNKLILEEYESKLKIAQTDLENLKDHIKNGIEIKKAVGVN